MSQLSKNFIQSSFRGGLNLFDEDHRLSEDQYKLAFNVRNLTGALTCIKAPLKIDAPVGKKQGIYGFDKYFLLFNSGNAYYTILDDNGDVGEWIRVNDFFMNPFVDYIYTQAVPASTLNLVRKLASTTQVNGTSANSNLNIQNIIINGNPAGLVCQDGLSQPFLIKTDGTAVRLQTYFQWHTDSREYVPIGTLMAYLNGILFVVNGNKIYRSVSGRPLDFVVNVDINGNKGGNADTVSYSVSSEDITALKTLNSGQLFVGTLLNCFPIDLNYDSVIFQEPTFINRAGMSVGIVNQHSFVDILGDYAWIDTDGLRSFNAINQLTNEGRDSVFSQLINSLFLNEVQGNLQAAFVHRNHGYFAVKTIYGNVVLVFNMLTQKWISIDMFEIPSIKQFAVGKQSANPQLFFITENEVYKYNGSEEFLQATVEPKTYISENNQVELKLRALRPVFNNSNDNSLVTIKEITNNVHKSELTQKLGQGQVFGLHYPVKFPAKYLSGDSLVDNLHFNFNNLSSLGWKTGSQISWKSQAELVQVQHDIDINTSQTNLRQQSGVYEE